MIFRIKLRWWSSLIATVAMFAIAWWLGGLDQRTGRIGSIALAVGFGVAAGLICGAINWLVHRTLFAIGRETYLRRFKQFALEVIGGMRPVEALAGGAMAGLGEEPLFRGVLLPACGPPWAGIVLAAVVFGLAHYLRRDYLGFLVWGMGEGVAFGILFVATGSIIVPAVAHGLFDTVGFLYFERLRDESRR